MKTTPLHTVLVRFGIIAAVLATLMLIAPGASGQTVPLNPTAVRYLEGNDAPVARYQAAAPGGKPFSWSLNTDATATNTAGTLVNEDHGDFKIGEKTGLLEFKDVPNYEASTASGGATDNEYTVQVLAKLDDAPATAPFLTRNVKVEVLNKDEVPEIQLSTRQPENGVELGIDGIYRVTTPADKDEDAGDNTTTGPGTGDVPTYRWATSPDGVTAWSNVGVATGAAATYTPVSGDIGKFLRVTLTYNGTDDGLADPDPGGTGSTATTKSVVAISEAAVQASSNVNAAPAFDDTDSATDGAQQKRSVAENSKAGASVGGPVAANDDRGLLTYSITGDILDGDSSVAAATAFKIDRATGQLTVGDATLNQEVTASSSYTVTVTATDGAGATGSVTVAIDVTDVNEAPTVTPGSLTTSFLETATSLEIGTFSAEDVDQVGNPPVTEVFTWSISDTTIFDKAEDTATPPVLTLSVNSGVLDYETAKSHKVDVIATDARGMAGKTSVTITVNNAEEPGTVTFTTQQPQVGVQLTAILEDPDGPTSGNTKLNPTWVWARGDSDVCSTATYTTIDDDGVTGADATKAAYTPVDADSGFCLQATARYDDGAVTTDPLPGDSRTTMGATANAVSPKRQANRPPVFKDAQDLDLTSAVRKVKENSEAGTNVGDPVTASDKDEMDASTYSLGGADADSFTITPGGGLIKVGENVSLDFETKPSYSVTVTATDGNTASTSIPVTIMIEDVNEAPTVSGPATAEVAEYTEASGATVVVGSYSATDVDADDQDANGNTVVAEWKVSGANSGEFEISDDGVLSFGEGKPNYDMPAVAGNEYEVMVVAVDSKGNEGSKTVTVTVTDEEEPGSVSFNVVQPGVGVELKATAMDDDSADDATAATWQWSSSDTRDGDYTDIDGATSASITPSRDVADMWLRATATYNEKSVSNELGHPVKAYTAVNAAPVWPDQDPDMTGEQIDQEREVAENSKAGTNVGDPVQAHDSDSIDVLTYTLADNETVDSDGDTATPAATDGDSKAFDIDQASGQISVKKGAMLDFETKDTYEVKVTATDGSGAPASVKVTINVTDVNDDPVITEATAATAATFLENSPAGTAFTEISPATATGVTYTATDEDRFDAEVKWTLEGADASAFTITGGTLAFKSPPNYEAKKSYKVTVVANDFDDRGSSDKVEVTVTIGNAPETGVIMISTQQPQVDTAFIATLSDPDGIDGEITWTTSGAGAADIVSNGSKSTSITYTPKAPGALAITAAYEDKHPDAAAAVTVSTADVRDKETSNRAPAFDDQDPDMPGKQNDQVTKEVPENSTEDTTVGTRVTAEDPDDSATAPVRTDTLTYALSDYVEGSGDAGSFKIDAGGATAGQIKVGADADLDFESGKTEYVVKVTATDPSGASATIKVIIKVTDVNEAPVLTTQNDDPEFDDGASVSRSVAENTAEGENVGDAVSATDPESDALTYTLGGDDAASFAIDASSGQIMTKAALDYEVKSSYSVMISVMDSKDGDGAPDTVVDDTIAVTITVTDAHPDCTVMGNNALTNDCEALLDSESALGGTLNWDESTAVNTWDGVTVSGEDGSERVTRLNLRTRSLDGTIPAALGKLDALERLWLHNNSLTGDIPDLSALTELTSLWLSGTNMDLTGGIPDWLGTMAHIDTVSLWGNNNLGGTIPDLSGMDSIVNLKLQSIGLTGAVPATLGELSTLERLYLKNNPGLSGEIPAELNNLTNLGILGIEGAGLTGAIPDLSGLTSLRTLNLRDNSLTGLSDLSALDSLQRLNLRNNSLSGEIPDLSGLDSLVRVWLDGNQFTSIPDSLANTNLTHLYLVPNPFEDGTCLPGDLEDVANNDFADADPDLIACAPTN